MSIEDYPFLYPTTGYHSISNNMSYIETKHFQKHMFYRAAFHNAEYIGKWSQNDHLNINKRDSFKEQNTFFELLTKNIRNFDTIIIDSTVFAMILYRNKKLHLPDIKVQNNFIAGTLLNLDLVIENSYQRRKYFYGDVLLLNSGEILSSEPNAYKSWIRIGIDSHSIRFL